MLKRSQIIYLFFFLFFSVLVIGLTFESCKQNDAPKETLLKAESNAFVGPDACKSCHGKEYNDWKSSGHFKAMMEANDTTVSGNFNNVTFSADGVTSKFFKQDNKFIINTEGEDGKNHDYEVKYTFGYYPLQQYLVAFPGGKMQVPRVSYDVVKKKWFHQYSGQKIFHSDWLHWTHQAQNWNSMCASCHSTNLQRNYDENTDSYKTTYSHINVSCESCHGMGKNHIDYIATDNYKKGAKVKGSYLLLFKGQKNSEQLGAACVQCHARRMEISSSANHSTEVLENFVPISPTTENYFPDGQFKDEDYEFGSFTQSKMYHRGIKCDNCHNPHSGKIVMIGNAICLQCHQTKYDSPQHYFHETNSEGSKCISCHMPTRMYMGVDERRDHSFRIPRPDQSVENNTPNACTNCHKDKKSKWAASAVVKWYGPNRKYHYSDDLIPGSKLDGNSIMHLKNLLDTSSTDMIRATAISYLGEITNEESLGSIIKYLADPSAMVRNQSLNSLAQFPPNSWVNAVTPMLKDPVRGVRIAAANTLSFVPQGSLNKESLSGYNSASIELLSFLHNQSDYPSGNISLGDYYYRVGDLKNAEKYYLRSLKIDSLANYSRLNLSSVYNALGQNGKALIILNEALKIDPSNPKIHYNLALLYVELNRKEFALKSFATAFKLKYYDDNFYYNYALFLQKQKSNLKADSVYSEGLRIFPYSEQLNYRAAYFFLQSNNKVKAMDCIRKLKAINPNNPDYGELFKLLN